MLKNLLSFVLLVPVLILFFIALCIIDVLMKMFRFFNLQIIERKCMKLLGRICMSFWNVWRTEIVFNSNGLKLDKDKPVLFVSSHHSSLDILLLFRTMQNSIGGRQLGFISRSGLDQNIPAISFYIRQYCHSLKRDPKTNESFSVDKLKAYAKDINQRNQTVVIFPEGIKPIQKGEHCRPFRRNGLLHMMDAMPDAQIVPIVIKGTGSFFTFPRKCKDLLHCFPRFGQTIQVELLSSIGTAAKTEDKRGEQISNIEYAIHKTYRELSTDRVTETHQLQNNKSPTWIH